MKKILLILLLQFLSTIAHSQHHEQCGTDVLHENLLKTNPEYARKIQEFDSNIMQHRHRRTVSEIYTIPVVVHIMHKGEEIGVGTNITDEQIRAQIRVINQRFRKIAGSSGDGDGVDTGIEFALAVRDPQGNCTNGITRTDMSGVPLYMSSGVRVGSGSGITDSALKALDRWDTSQYYNIWVVSELNNNNGSDSLQGYAYFASAHGLSYDGAVVHAASFTNTNKVATTHELGHAFNLYHTFEGDNNGSCPTPLNGCGNGIGDCCADTPPHIRYTNCNTDSSNDCDPENPDLSFTRNYMTYSSTSANCQNMYTNDQKNRMISAITVLRSSFLASNGNLSLVPSSVHSAAMEISASVVCAGTVIKLTDISNCIPNTYIDDSSWDNITFLWTVINGTNTYTYNTQNAYFVPTVEGSYDVTLTVTINNTTATITRNRAIFAISAIGVASCIPNVGSLARFSSSINLVKFNTINNPTSITYNEGYQNYRCTKITSVLPGSTHLLTLGVGTSSFFPEHFRVYIDYNNNGTFQTDELIMQGVAPMTQSNTFTQNVTIPLHAIQNTILTMRVIGEAIELTDGEVACSDRFYLGDIEDYGIYITSSLSTDTTTAINDITLSPNPATTAFTLTSNTTIDNIVLYNMLGQMVLQKQLNVTQSIIDVSGLSAGAYVVQATAGSKTSSLKLVKN